ncbi:MAG: GNAT family N-acetyltransferase [Candidatus Dormibacteraceae bacterium]
MDATRLRATYLTGETIYLRAPVKADAGHAAAWLEDTFPINTPRAEALLEEEFANPSWEAIPIRLVIVRSDGDRIVGGALLRGGRHDWRLALTLTVAPWEEEPDRVRADALRLLVPWVRDDLEAMTLALEIGVDQPRTIAVAEELGMERTAVLREWLLRPGGRVAAACYQALFQPWVVRDA